MNKAATHQAKNLGEVYRAVSGIVLRRLPVVAGQTSSSIKDLTRKPEDSLYLLVKKPRKHHAWQFPQGGQDPGESVAEAALRELREECGPNLKVRLIDSISPIGTYQYKFPPNFNRWDNAVGAKVSFFRADWLEGQCQPDGEEIIDFAWLTKEELVEYIHPEYKEAIQSFLV